MDTYIIAKAEEIINMNFEQLEKLKQDIGLAVGLSPRAEMYLLEAIEAREVYLRKRYDCMLEDGEVKLQELN